MSTSEQYTVCIKSTLLAVINTALAAVISPQFAILAAVYYVLYGNLDKSFGPDIYIMSLEAAIKACENEIKGSKEAIKKQKKHYV